jgi:hypothetical protein
MASVQDSNSSESHKIPFYKGGKKMKRIFIASLFLALVIAFGASFAADTVPVVIEQPGTQPMEVGNPETPDKCDNCHGGFDPNVEPNYNWRGSMMAQAGRDPIFWATMAIAEQDFDGSGDLCIRCHSTAGWISGRSTPTDGSGLNNNIDADGVECDFCHTSTNPDNSEHLGVMFDPYIANQQDLPGPLQPGDAEGYYGSGMASLWGDSDKLGPYLDTAARHKMLQSKFHRSVDFCGTCHDVSNPAVGNLAHNNGTQPTADPVIADGSLEGPVDTKAAFNNPPYKYGVVERTFSEYKASKVPGTLVSEYVNLPTELQAGAFKAAYDAAMYDPNNINPNEPNYEDGAERFFSCQTCHMPPRNGKGCNKPNAPQRTDVPQHDMTGGNYWMGDAILYLDSIGKLRIGDRLNNTQIAAIQDGKMRAMETLDEAASLSVIDDTVKVVNLTGHKLISGYPEGRRMWLNIKWYDADGGMIHEDGAYGPIDVSVPNPAGGPDVQVESILDLSGTNTKIYEAHYGMTKEWAAQLIGLGYPENLALSYNRYDDTVVHTLGDLATADPGTEFETFHFVLNNVVHKDNRIPPYGMDYEIARKRNALPTPPAQYGGTPGGTYNHWDVVDLTPPQDAVSATIDLLYQPTSWEYIQFLYLANNGSIPFLAEEGINMLDAWLNNGMAAPYIMASTVWPACDPEQGGEGPYDDITCTDGQDNDCDGLIDDLDPDCEMPQVQCSGYTTKEECQMHPECRWNKKKGCLNR